MTTDSIVSSSAGASTPSSLNLAGGLENLRLKAQKDPKAAVREAAKQFEGMLMANLFQELRKTVHPSGLFGGGGSANGTYEYLLDQAVVNHAMDGGRTWGLRDRIEASLKAAQSK